jgi:alkanesulfonate monooxygenase SsuD/methylene tetrahydromethanopterin reductase-like flavin-dependent oxidoreductase (luciferase family)
MTNVGAVCLPQVPPDRLRAVARTADDAGLEELWLWEDCFWNGGIASVAAALAWTDRLRVGIGVLPVPLRNVAVAAMEIATLDQLFPGRLMPGVGHGVQDWMAQVGVRAESPMTLLREYLTALRALLRGEKLTVEGRYVRLTGVALDRPPATPPAVFAAATGPRSLRLSGELADGTILTASTTAEQIREARRLVDQGREQGGRTEPHPVIVYLLAATGPGAAGRLEAEWRAMGDDSVPGIGAAGDAQAVADAVQRWAEAGADTVVLQPTVDEPDPEGFVRFVAEEVRPLVPA